MRCATPSARSRNANRALARLGAEARQVRAEAGADRRATRVARSVQVVESRGRDRAHAGGVVGGAARRMRCASCCRATIPPTSARRLHYLGVHLARRGRAASPSSARRSRSSSAWPARRTERAARLRAIEQASRADRDKVLAERRERRRVLEHARRRYPQEPKGNPGAARRRGAPRAAGGSAGARRGERGQAVLFPRCAASCACRCAGN